MPHLHDYLESFWGPVAILTFVGLAAGQSLIAIWAATSRAHWLLRALAVWGGVMLLVPIRAYEPAAIFVIASPLIVIILVIARWINERRRTLNRCQPVAQSPVATNFRPVDGYHMAAIVALLIAGLEPIYQGWWWYDLAAFLAWVGIIAALATVAWDFARMRGRWTWQFLLASFHYAAAGLRLLASPLESHDAPAPPANVSSSSKSQLRFGIPDLLFLTLLVALVVSGLQAIDQDYTWYDWQAFAAWGLVLALIVSLAYACVISRWRLLFAPFLVLIVVLAAWPIPTLFPRSAAEMILSTLVVLGDRQGDGLWTGGEEVALLAVLLKDFALLMIALSLLVILSRSSSPPSPRRTLARGVLAALVVAGSVPLACLYLQMLSLTPAPPAFATSANHYQRIITIVSHAESNWWSWPPPLVPPVAGDKQQLIAELSQLTREPNYVAREMPLRPYTADQLQEHRRISSSTISFAHVVAAEAALAKAQGEPDRAAELALVNVRLGTMLRRGGTRSDYWTGERCQAEGYKVLAKVRERLTGDQLRETLAALQQALTELENMQSVFLRDRAFAERIGGWRTRLMHIFWDLWGVTPPGYVDAEITAFNTLLQTDLAIRLYQYDHHRPPATLQDLVPTYLPTVPLDPLAGALAGPAQVSSHQPLCYRVEGDQFVLYSVGYLGQDKGGHFTNECAIHQSHEYDIDIDTWIRP